MSNTSTFYNRTHERAILRDALASPRSELIIVYGRRGVGKSALLSQALQEADYPAIFYRATRRTLPLQLAALTEAAREAYPNAFLGQPFASASVFLDFLAFQAGERQAAGDPIPVVAVIDELPYLADVDSGFLTTLQHWWDANKRRMNLKLFLAGSYVAFMERQVLDVNAPLYNRRTGALKLEPMDYAEAGLFFPAYTPREKMETFAVLGGMPSYLEQFDPAQGLAENVLATALRRNTYLSEEPDWLLLEDLRRDVTYGSILRAVAGGERRPSGIAQAIGRDSAQAVAPQLSVLQDLGLLIREVPITERGQARSRTSLYFIADNYLDFWYRFVDPARGLVSRGLGSRVWEQTVAPNLGQYVSRPAFERACRQFLWRVLASDAPPASVAPLAGLGFTDVGTWWGAGDREIDVMATNAQSHVVLAGSCKWTEAAVDVREYAALQRDLALVQLDGYDPHLVLFSRSGFTPRLMDLAAAQDPKRLTLVDLETMYGV